MQTRWGPTAPSSSGPGSRASTVAADSPPWLIRRSFRTRSAGTNAEYPPLTERAPPQSPPRRGQVDIAPVEQRRGVTEREPVELGRRVRIRIDLDQGRSGGGHDPQARV